MSTLTEVGFFDGKDNQRHNVVVRISDCLDIQEDGASLACWLLDDVRLLPSAHGMARYGLADTNNLARLEVTDELLMAAIKRSCPNLGRGEGAIASRRTTLRIIGWSLAAAASAFGLVIFGLPTVAKLLAPHIPQVLQYDIGEASAKQLKLVFHASTCRDPNGQAVLDNLVAKLARAGGLKQHLRPRVIKTKIANAMALPGGRVYVFSKLLDEAQTPDELGGVIAHELGHEAHYDSMRRLIESGGTGLLFGMVFGDFTGSAGLIMAARTLINASYSRRAEKAADDFSIKVMTKLGRSPKPLGDLLQRLAKGHDIPEAMSLLADHPPTQNRLADIAAHDVPDTGPPLLSPAQWVALQSICAN